MWHASFNGYLSVGMATGSFQFPVHNSIIIISNAKNTVESVLQGLATFGTMDCYPPVLGSLL